MSIRSSDTTIAPHQRRVIDFLKLVVRSLFLPGSTRSAVDNPSAQESELTVNGALSQFLSFQ